MSVGGGRYASAMTDDNNPARSLRTPKLDMSWAVPQLGDSAGIADSLSADARQQAATTARMREMQEYELATTPQDTLEQVTRLADLQQQSLDADLARDKTAEGQYKVNRGLVIATLVVASASLVVTVLGIIFT